MSATTPPAAAPSLEPAGLVSRGAAGVIDIVVVSAVGVIVLWSTQAVLRFFGVPVDTSGIDELIGVSAAAFITLVYFAGSWALFEKTPGCWLLGIRVVCADGSRVHLVRSVARLLLTNLSTIVFMLGWVWAVFDRRHRAWHDILAHTLVVYEDRSGQAPAIVDGAAALPAPSPGVASPTR